MTIHEFALVAHGMTHCDEVPLGEVLKAGCDDSLVGSRDGQVFFDFGREAASLEEAVGSAILALKKARISAWLESVGDPDEVAADRANDARAPM